jgi:hypothetical protein
MTSLSRIKEIWAELKPLFLADIERRRLENPTGEFRFVNLADIDLNKEFREEAPLRNFFKKFDIKELADLTDVMYFGRDESRYYKKKKYTAKALGGRIAKDPHFSLNGYFPMLEKSSYRVVEYMESALKVLYVPV